MTSPRPASSSPRVGVLTARRKRKGPTKAGPGALGYTLRSDFGLTSFRLGARPNVDVMWSPAQGVGVTLLIVILILLASMLS